MDTIGTSFRNTFDFQLDEAPWPALVSDPYGILIQTNREAVATFGRDIMQPRARLASIWSPQNDLTAEHFVGSAADGAAGRVLEFKTVRGLRTFTVTLCLVEVAHRKLWILQLLPLLPESAGAVAPVQMAPTEQTVEVGHAQRQKLDCALQLARTVALDFNNALTSILGHASFLLAQVDEGHPFRKSLQEIQKAADRATEVAHQLSGFGSDEKTSDRRTAGNINGLLRRTVEGFQNSTQDLKWVLQLEPNIYGVESDEAKLQQAFVKVIENGVQAMPRGGRLVVQTRNLQLTEPTQDRTAHLLPGHYVCVEISDDGAGIEPLILSRVFEPFFTTKYGHRGLGLAFVYGIVTNHRGGVSISSHQGSGTNVRLYLPAVNATIEEGPAHEPETLAGRTVLIVDDEELVVSLSQMVLAGAGFDVVTATSGEKALAVISKGERTIDLMVTDMVMPGMTGRELIEKVRVISPQTRVLCSTACSGTNTPGQTFACLSKPFTSQELLRRVGEVLS